MPDLRNQFADHLKPTIIFSLNTEMCECELVSLKWQLVGFVAKILTSEGIVVKSCNTRNIPLNAEAFTVLKRWRKSNNN